MSKDKALQYKGIVNKKNQRIGICYCPFTNDFCTTSNTISDLYDVDKNSIDNVIRRIRKETGYETVKIHIEYPYGKRTITRIDKFLFTRMLEIQLKKKNHDRVKIVIEQLYDSFAKKNFDYPKLLCELVGLTPEHVIDTYALPKTLFDLATTSKVEPSEVLTELKNEPTYEVIEKQEEQPPVIIPTPKLEFSTNVTDINADNDYKRTVIYLSKSNYKQLKTLANLNDITLSDAINQLISDSKSLKDGNDKYSKDNPLVLWKV